MNEQKVEAKSYTEAELKQIALERHMRGFPMHKGTTYRKAFEKMGRNEPCYCGSGKKYKRCCYEKTHDIYVEVQGGSHVYGIRD